MKVAILLILLILGSTYASNAKACSSVRNNDNGETNLCELVTGNQYEPLPKVLFKERELAPLPTIQRCTRVARVIRAASVGSQLSSG
jgi:hypothetical protein